MTKQHDTMMVSEAAAELGVCQETVRAWFDKGTLDGYRHPVNDYRIISRQSVMRLKNKMNELEEKL